jgi:hypothetical protein
MRQPQTRNAARAQTALSVSLPAPVGGWDQKNALAAMPPQNAVVMDNWIPRAGYCEARAGSGVQVNGFASPVHSLLVWRGPQNDHLFAGSGAGVYDVNTQGAALGAPVYTATTSNPWACVNFQNTGGAYLWACNGGDTPVYYNGAAWTQNTGLSGTDGALTLNPANLISCFLNSSRIWGIEKGSTRAWFLPVQAITGAMQCLDLGSVFTLGGALVAGSGWTVEGGVGPSEYAVFLTSKGEIAVYQGTDPTNADNWSLVGVYVTGEPIGGSRCLLRMGADVMVITTLGVLPLSQILTLDRAAQENVSITDGIKNAFYTAQRAYGGNFGWEGITYPAGGLTLFNVPTSAYSAAVQYVQADQTGKWCRFVGLNAICWGLANGGLYFGAVDGVYQADTGATDNGVPVTYDVQWAFSAYGLPGRQKAWTLARPLLETSPRIQPALAMLADFASSTPVNIPTVPAAAATVWGQMVWGSTLWTDPDAIRYSWAGVGAIGFVGAPRMTFSISAPAGSPVGDGAGDTLADGAGDELAVSAATYAVPVQLLGVDVVFKPGTIL